jgi:hypothetical protein
MPERSTKTNKAKQPQLPPLPAAAAAADDDDNNQ